jgi:hypothetical protein
MSRCQFDERALRLGIVLADVNFPATKWQLVIHAEFIGADIRSRIELSRLPTRSYPDLAAVISTVRSDPSEEDG